MRAALKLARKPTLLPYPNPWVGCVIVRNSRVVGRGWHRGPGTMHAEAAALAEAEDRARGATVYVTLEPCCHQGRTPPCTDALIRAGVGEVVYAIRDPNPLVSGKGARALRRQGIKVTQGACAAEAREINEVYLKYRSTGMPFVSIKVASSLDGKIATRTGHSRWITDPAARRRARRIRADHQAVLVGIGTVLRDDPDLGARIRGAQDIWRIILDSDLRTPPRSRVVQTGRCIVACTSTASRGRQARLENLGARVLRFSGKRVPLRRLLSRLAGLGIISVMVEGGAAVLGSFLDAGLVDRAYWFIAPKIMGSQEALSAIGGRGASLPSGAWNLQHLRVEPAGRAVLLTGFVSKAPTASRRST
jgi:diaminohydroxyphosphoribosylaminopyrimidine deaminase/5-amino-6-(5-phosphoribosylamino)uracil reductase